MGRFSLNPMKKKSKIFVHLSTDNIKDHRYRSIDDWDNPSETLDGLIFSTQTADMGNMDYNFLVLMHALVEQYLCHKHKITDEQVTGFDMAHPEMDDPGEDPKAPYHKQHQIANDIESTLSVALGVKWFDYETAIDKTLDKFPKKKKK